MNDGGSIGQFFFNIIPGGIFLFLLLYFLFNINLFHLPYANNTLFLGFFTIVSIFLGYIFQAFTVVLRQEFKWNEKAINEIVDKNLDKFSPVYKKINNVKTFSKEDCNKFLDTFYLMDCYLRGDYKSFLPTHFSSIFAMWSNMFVGMLILVIIALVRGFFSPISNKDIWLIQLCFSSILVLWFFGNKFLKSYYRAILNIYYMKTEVDTTPKGKQTEPNIKKQNTI